MTSEEASKKFEDNSLDFVFIDACHEYECVKEDIIHWLPKIAPNGILAGHDADWEGVQRAVSELIPNAKRVSRSCWIIEL